MIGEIIRRDLKSILNARSGAMAAARFVRLSPLIAPQRAVKEHMFYDHVPVPIGTPRAFKSGYPHYVEEGVEANLACP